MSKVKTSSYSYIFGQNLARIRKNNGLTHENMEDYGITRSYYGKIELGIHSPSLDKLILIAKAFGVTVDQLFLDKDGKPL